jgi:hypothetical protein
MQHCPAAQRASHSLRDACNQHEAQHPKFLLRGARCTLQVVLGWPQNRNKIIRSSAPLNTAVPQCHPFSRGTSRKAQNGSWFSVRRKHAQIVLFANKMIETRSVGLQKMQLQLSQRNARTHAKRLFFCSLTDSHLPGAYQRVKTEELNCHHPVPATGRVPSVKRRTKTQ